VCFSPAAGAPRAASPRPDRAPYSSVAVSNKANNPVLIDIVSPRDGRLQWPFAVIVVYYNYHCKHAAVSARAAFGLQC